MCSKCSSISRATFGVLAVSSLALCALLRNARFVPPIRSSVTPASGMTQPSLPSIVLHAFEEVAENAKEELILGSETYASPYFVERPGANFEAVKIALPLAPPIIKHDPKNGDAEKEKNLVGFHQSDGVTRTKRCVVYGMGIAWESTFEQQMAAHGCETHAFDCTVDPHNDVVANKEFTFHHWCIGAQAGKGFSNKDNIYLRGKKEQEFQFKTLAETMRVLGHESIDILKFDIEGFEWTLFEKELLPMKNPPKQLAFELHTEGSKPVAVQPRLVRGKGYSAVNQLFLDLFKKGYRVTSKEINQVDEKCAEFVLVNVNDSV